MGTIVVSLQLGCRLGYQDAGLSIFLWYFADSYNKIAHKACRVGGVEGVCMFVWECIKTDGHHMGMCMDGFMFGSCCTHDEASNSLKPPTGQKEGEEVVAPGISVKNTTELVTPTAPTPTVTTGAASVITSRPLTIQRPTSHPLTQRPAPSTAPPVISTPLTSSPSSREPPSTPAFPVPPTPPSPPTRPTRPPKPTK